MDVVSVTKQKYKPKHGRIHNAGSYGKRKTKKSYSRSKAGEITVEGVVRSQCKRLGGKFTKPKKHVFKCKTRHYQFSVEEKSKVIW